MSGLGVGGDGAPTYVLRTMALLEDLLAGPVPNLEPLAGSGRHAGPGGAVARVDPRRGERKHYSPDSR